MFRDLRRKDRALNVDDISRILENSEFGIFATVGCDGYPYGAPVSFVYHNNSVYFHCAMNTGHKLENIKNNDKVCFTVVGKTEVLAEKFSTKYESVVLFGRAAEIFDEEKENALQQLVMKYSPDFLEKGKKYIEDENHLTSVIKIEIEHITGKARK